MSTSLTLSSASQAHVQGIVEKAREIMEIDDLTKYDATETLIVIGGVLKSIEEARAEAVKPHVAEQKRLNSIAKELSAPVEAERLRLNRALGDYAALELSKERARKIQEAEDLKQRERELADKIATADTLTEVDDLREEYSRETHRLQQQVVKAEEPVVKVHESWDYEVTDIHALYKEHPEAVKMEPRPSIIKTLLAGKNGSLPGVVARKVHIAKPK
jgi:hypothetical protein